VEYGFVLMKFLVALLSLPGSSMKNVSTRRPNRLFFSSNSNKTRLRSAHPKDILAPNYRSLEIRFAIEFSIPIHRIAMD
jgi:hypothetical protein